MWRGFTFNLLNFLCGKAKKNNKKTKSTPKTDPKMIDMNEIAFKKSLQQQIGRPSIVQLNGAKSRDTLFGAHSIIIPHCRSIDQFPLFRNALQRHFSTFSKNFVLSTISSQNISNASFCDKDVGSDVINYQNKSNSSLGIRRTKSWSINQSSQNEETSRASIWRRFAERNFFWSNRESLITKIIKITTNNHSLSSCFPLLEQCYERSSTICWEKATVEVTKMTGKNGSNNTNGKQFESIMIPSKWKLFLKDLSKSHHFLKRMNGKE